MTNKVKDIQKQETVARLSGKGGQGQETTTSQTPAKNKTEGKMKDSQNISVSFQAFATILLRSPFFWAVTQCHIQDEWRPQLITRR